MSEGDGSWPISEPMSRVQSIIIIITKAISRNISHPPLLFTPSIPKNTLHKMLPATRTMRLLSARSLHHLRPFSTTPQTASAWSTGPSPPRLPKEEQEMFEKLQKQSTGAFSTPKQAEPTSESPEGESMTKNMSSDEMLEQLRERARLAAKGDGEELHPNVRRGAKAEFEGDTNPKTGEVGGPKNEPLRWGVSGDWSYNGRVTDF